MMIYSEWLEKNPTVLKEKTELDEATIELLFDFFQFRELVDDDKFEAFFVRSIKMLTWQYNEMLRLESVKIDPMVSNYLERYVLSTGTDKNLVTNTNKNSSKSTGSSNGTNSSTSTPGVTEETETITTPDTTVTTSGTASGTASGETSGTTSGTSTKEDTKTSKSIGSDTSSNERLQGVLPDSGTYGPNSITEPTNVDQYGFPNALNWTYSSGQGADRGFSTNQSSTDDKTTSKDTTSETETGETSSHTSSESESTVKTSGSNTINTTTTRRGSDKTTGENSSTDTSETTSNSEGSTNGNSEYKHEDKVIHTGRQEAPQDMLMRAKNWFSNMNSFKWLRDELDSCFLGVYDI